VGRLFIRILNNMTTKQKIFKAVLFIGIVGNIAVGVTYLAVSNWIVGVPHVASGLIFIPVFLDSKEYV
jgi:hypothetical protein